MKKEYGEGGIRGMGSMGRVTDPAEPPRALRVAAFFDVDNTIIRGASSYHIARGLREHGFFTRRDMLRFGFEQAKYRLFGETAEQMDLVNRDAAKFIKGWSVAEMAAIGEEVWDEVLAHRIYPGTKAIIDEHRAQGHEVWIVSAVPEALGRLIAAKVGATGALGTVAVEENGFLTGEFEGGLLHGPRKGIAVRELAAREGFDLEASYAYGDSANDESMLDAVGHPCAINPDSKLRRICKERGWPIHEFRKRRKNGRRGIVRASITGTVWVVLAVLRSIRKAIFRR